MINPFTPSTLWTRGTQIMGKLSDLPMLTSQEAIEDSTVLEKERKPSLPFFSLHLRQKAGHSLAVSYLESRLEEQ